MSDGACPDGSEREALVRQIDALRNSNYALREAMVVASDAALRDGASGLYGREYAESFLRALFEGGRPFLAAFIRVDRIKELNRRIGAAAVDGLIKDLAALALEREPDGVLFRWSGPVILMVLELERAFAGLESLRAAAASERRFAVPITVSIAVVRSRELGSQPHAAIHSLARERLRLLERRGGDDVLDKSDLKLEDRTLVLVLDADRLFLDFLVESLDREGFRSLGSTRGGEALEIMDRTRPELVIADESLPQYDAFQLRERMRSSGDLHDVPFILLSEDKSDESIARAHALSILHVLKKPVSMVELVGLARSLLARSEDGA